MIPNYIYVSFKINDTTDEKAALTRIQACVREIKAWLNHHRLHLNDNKTEVLVITTPSSANNHGVTFELLPSLATLG